MPIMQLTNEQVRHIAKLARINLSDAEVEKFTTQLGDIVGFVEQLNKVDTQGVSETNQVTGLANVEREDEIAAFEKMEALINCSNNPIEGGQIKVKKSI
jgi:aspartyl-tRNA(Asn)/glutamyl-tRNA(Gln) amidotransferase subunit C